MHMGRSIVQFRNSRRARLALWCVVALLPALLCACRQHRNLAAFDPVYDILPGQIHLDDEILDADTSHISTIDVAAVPEPTRLRDRKPMVPWDMTLQEVIFHALTNSTVIRQGGQFLSPNNTLLRSPDGMPTVYDQMIQSSGVLFGQRGEEAALSEFDSQFTTRMLWGNSSTVQNFNQLGIAAGNTLNEDTAQFQASLQKALYTGGQFGLSQSWNYSASNASRLFPSVYEGNMRAEYRQPLLAGAGSDYAMIAGPISDNIQGVTGVQQGILIARINNTLAIADFELNVIGYVRDVELQYWKLHLAYETHRIEEDSLKDAQRILDMVESRDGAQGGDLSYVVEAREGVLQSQQRVLEALDAVYTNESQLRLLMGFSLQTERMIRPIDSPMIAEMQHDWSSSLGSALARRPELRRQKNSIQSAELQLQAAMNLNRPRLDLLASGQLNGFGDDLLGPKSADGTTRKLGSAYGRMLGGRETGWNLGVEYSQPLGMRFSNEQVKNHEFKLTKAMKLLEAQEAEILHELTAAFQAVDRHYLAMQNQAAIVDNAVARMDAAEADYESNKDGRSVFDLATLNRARDIYAQAVVQLGQAQVEYSMSLTDIEYRCGRLLEHHHVTLSASPEFAMHAPIVEAPGPELPPAMTPPALPPPADPAPADPTPADESPDKADATPRTETKAAIQYVSDIEPVEDERPAGVNDTVHDDETMLDTESAPGDMSGNESTIDPESDTTLESGPPWEIDPAIEFQHVTPVDFQTEVEFPTFDETLIESLAPEDSERQSVSDPRPDSETIAP